MVAGAVNVLMGMHHRVAPLANFAGMSTEGQRLPVLGGRTQTRPGAAPIFSLSVCSGA
jgi:hypothetical protein